MQDSTKEFRAHLWDFGGQEIQYYIHQFFLTARSLYLLVFNDRNNDQNLDYWFRTISLLGGSKERDKSSILIIQNEKNTAGQISSLPKEVYQKRYEKSFSNMLFREVNLADTTDGRLETIKTEVEKQLSNLKHIGDELPKGWIEVREKMEAFQKGESGKTINHIPFSQFRVICETSNVKTETSQLVLSGYLHDLGIILHYQEDESLFDRIFLNPHWVANAVYRILSDKQLVTWNARFSKEWIFEQWGDEYTPEEKNFFLQLMQKDVFDLCYKIKNKKKFNYLLPQVLCPCAPEMANDWLFFQSLRFQYRYQFMPIGVITRIIVRLSQWILQKPNREDLVWKSGVILERFGSRALVQETLSNDGARLIDIAITGSQPHDCQELLTIIREQVEKIHDKYPGIQVKKRVPCCCDNCLRSDDPKMFEYETLLKYRNDNLPEIHCDRWENITAVPVYKLLENIAQPDRKKSFRIGEGQPENPDHSQQTWSEQVGTPKSQLQPVLDRRSSVKQQKSEPIKEEQVVERNKIFISYAHEDEKWLKQVQKHLKVLELQGIEVNLWDDTRIQAGDKWREEIKKAIAAAKVAILLVSTDFLSSDFIINDELPPLLQSAEKEKGTVILPLILKPCRFDRTKSLSQFQAVNDPRTPLIKLDEAEREEVLVELANSVEDEILKKTESEGNRSNQETGN